MRPISQPGTVVRIEDRGGDDSNTQHGVLVGNRIPEIANLLQSGLDLRCRGGSARCQLCAVALIEDFETFRQGQPGKDGVADRGAVGRNTRADAGDPQAAERQLDPLQVNQLGASRTAMLVASLTEPTKERRMGRAIECRSMRPKALNPRSSTLRPSRYRLPSAAWR